MIHIYRATRYPDRDFFTFQATDDTYQQFRFRFPVKVTEAKRGFEGGYFTYLRDNYRTTFFDLIKSYLRENYVPPELRLSAFRTDEPLTDLWPSPMWQQKVTDAVKAVFAEQGYAVNLHPVPPGDHRMGKLMQQHGHEQQQRREHTDTPVRDT